MISQESIAMIREDPKAYLSRCFRLGQQIAIKRRRIEHLRQISVQITTTIKAVSAYSGPSDKIGNCATEIVALTQEIEEEIIALLVMQRETANAIDELVRDPKQRAILEGRYLAGASWEELAYNMNYAYRWVLRLHKYGLAAMKEAANGYCALHEQESS